MAVVITRQEYRFENNVVLWGKERQGLQDKVDNAKQETIDILKSANADAQKMRDSLYTLGMKQREIEKQVIKNKR